MMYKEELKEFKIFKTTKNEYLKMNNLHNQGSFGNYCPTLFDNDITFDDIKSKVKQYNNDDIIEKVISL